LPAFPWSTFIRSACSTAASSTTAARALEPLKIGALSVSLAAGNESSSLRRRDQFFHLLVRTYMDAFELLMPLLRVQRIV
jgi:hypothetical protein